MRKNNLRTGLGWGLLGMLVVAIAVSLAGENGRPATSTDPSERVSAKGKIVKTDKEWKKSLSREQYRILRRGGTERPFTGKYDNHDEEGEYKCAGCGQALFSSEDKFDAGCGWPSFTSPTEKTRVEERVDIRFGMKRQEVKCAKCDGHLGHVFNDGPLPTGLRYCINSTALEFGEKAKTVKKEGTQLRTATFGMGCFWCSEALFERMDGVESVKVGYMGGRTKNPTYKEVCTGRTGHAEVARIEYDANKVSFDELLQMFWKVHDPTTLNRQGGDIGTQYRSAIFYTSEEEKVAAELSKRAAGRKIKKPIVTEIVPAAVFYEAEDYHQDYYENNKNAPYCRAVIAPKLKKFKP